MIPLQKYLLLAHQFHEHCVSSTDYATLFLQVTKFTPSTSTRFSFLSIFSTFPCFPLSFPSITSTYSCYTTRRGENHIATHNRPGLNNISCIYLFLHLGIQPMLYQRMNNPTTSLHFLIWLFKQTQLLRLRS